MGLMFGDISIYIPVYIELQHYTRIVYQQHSDLFLHAIIRYNTQEMDKREKFYFPETSILGPLLVLVVKPSYLLSFVL